MSDASNNRLWHALRVSVVTGLFVLQYYLWLELMIHHYGCHRCHETVTHLLPLALQDLVLQQLSFSAIQSIVVTSGSTVAAAKTTQAHVPHFHKLKCLARVAVPTSPDMRHTETGPSGELGTHVSPFLSFVILSQLNNIYEIYVYRSVPRLVTVYSRELHCIQYPFPLITTHGTW